MKILVTLTESFRRRFIGRRQHTEVVCLLTLQRSRNYLSTGLTRILIAVSHKVWEMK